MKSKITKYLHSKQMQEHIQVPNLNENKELIKRVIIEEKSLKTDYHLLQRKGILKILKRLEETHLKDIPIDILNNSFGPIMFYFNLLNDFEERKDLRENNELKEIFYKSYEQTIENINYFLNLNDMV